MTAAARRPARWQLEFIERVGALADVSGLPPSHVQVFAWLVVSDPPHQSSSDIRAALGLSAGAVSMATTALVRMGLVERMTQVGRRRVSYRFRPGGWERMLRVRLEAASQMRAIAEDALAHAPHPPAVLAEMRDMYGWFEDRLADLLAGAPSTTGNATGSSRTPVAVARKGRVSGR
ncbi:MAG: GbsR/MarR family transcriptional regulator [Acidimicrobiales bacterium]